MARDGRKRVFRLAEHLESGFRVGDRVSVVETAQPTNQTHIERMQVSYKKKAYLTIEPADNAVNVRLCGRAGGVMGLLRLWVSNAAANWVPVGSSARAGGGAAAKVVLCTPPPGNNTYGAPYIRRR